MFVYEQVPSLRPLKLNNLRLVTVSCLWFVFHKANPSNGCIVLIFWNMRGKFLPSSYIVYVKPSLEPLFINDGKCYSIRSCYPNVFFFFLLQRGRWPSFYYKTWNGLWTVQICFLFLKHVSLWIHAKGFTGLSNVFYYTKHQSLVMIPNKYLIPLPPFVVMYDPTYQIIG